MSLRPEDVRLADTLAVDKALTKAIYFIAESKDPRPLQCKGVPVFLHQEVARETQLLEVLFLSVSLPFQSGLFNLQGLESSCRFVFQTSRLVYKLASHCFQDHRVNESYTAQLGWSEAMLSHLNFGIGAEEALTQLLSDNKQLLNEYVNDSFVKYLVELLKQSPSYVYLDFLTAVCGYGDNNDQCINDNQEYVLTNLVRDIENSKMLMKLEVLSCFTSFLSWVLCFAVQKKMNMFSGNHWRQALELAVRKRRKTKIGFRRRRLCWQQLVQEWDYGCFCQLGVCGKGGPK